MRKQNKRFFTFSRERAKRFFTEQNERSGTLIEILLRPKLLRNKAIEISAMNSQSSINWVQFLTGISAGKCFQNSAEKVRTKLLNTIGKRLQNSNLWVFETSTEAPTLWDASDWLGPRGCFGRSVGTAWYAVVDREASTFWWEASVGLEVGQSEGPFTVNDLYFTN